MKLNNNALQELYDELVDCAISISPYVESPVEKAFRECDEKLSESVTFEKIRSLERANSNLLGENLEAISKNRKLEKDLEALKKDNEWLKRSRIEWAKKFAERGGQIKELKATLEKTNADRTELQKDRDSYHGLYTELRKDYDKLFEENKKLKARTDCLRYEVEWYRKHYKEKSDKIKELKRVNGNLQDTVQDLSIKVKRHQINVGKESRYLWDMLQNVNNSQPFELATCFPDVTGMEDILNWDLEDFLDAYKKWQEEKEKERTKPMRDYLERFCRGRVCYRCPLHTDGFVCGRGKWFGDMTDEELKRHYDKAIDCNIDYNKRMWHGDAIAEKIKIEPWSCTLEGTINVEFDRDLLEKVCGVKPEEGAHKLEYGDAVRLHWRDYDYMYIGPDEKEGALVRLFDPKNHAIVTTHIANVRYNGGKIILTNEDDLRMIWKDKK